MADYTEQIVWHEVTIRPPTDEENEEYWRITGMDAACWLDCETPEDGDKILAKTKYGVGADICREDEYGVSLESLGDWTDVLAWAEMPKGVRDDG